jgi:hypothetical protein
MSALQRDFLLWKCMCGVYVKHNDALGVTVVLICAVAGETTTFVKSSCNNRPDPSTITIGFVAMHWNYPQVICSILVSRRVCKHPLTRLQRPIARLHAKQALVNPSSTPNGWNLWIIEYVTDHK